MVLSTRFAVILLLIYLTCAKTENDLERIAPSSIEIMQRGFQRHCAKVPVCRNSKILTALRDSFNVNTETSRYNLKVKKKPESGHKEILEGYDSFEVGTQTADNGIIAEDLEKYDLIQNLYDEFEVFKPDEMKRGNSLPSTGCDCKVKNELLDLGHSYFPRYLFNAVCHKDDETLEFSPKCLPGAQCRPLEYKVRVLTHRSHNDHLHKDPTASLLPEALRSVWKFKTVTIAAGCFCS